MRIITVSTRNVAAPTDRTTPSAPPSEAAAIDGMLFTADLRREEISYFSSSCLNSFECFARSFT